KANCRVRAVLIFLSFISFYRSIVEMDWAKMSHAQSVRNLNYLEYNHCNLSLKGIGYKSF
ncbi:MAG: hypothetical protein ACE5GN_02695, partial [Waddliaceae bacterium]